jgi:hypothetical protein
LDRKGEETMRRLLFRISMLAVFIILLTRAAHADPAPGDPCAPDGIHTQTGGAESAGAGGMMVCAGAAWKVVLGYDGAGQVTKIGNQECAADEILKFDGLKWACAAGGEPCGGIGRLCADGTVYAGLSPDGRAPLYTTTADQGAFKWGPQDGGITGACVNGQQSGCTTGAANTSALAALPGAYNAAKQCDSLTAGGHADWYLPSLNELSVLYQNQGSIGGFDISSAAYYWSSSEADNYAWYMSFSFNAPYTAPKTDSYLVRCVRK